MPFTFSHPAIVLPLLNRRKRIFSATGLIIGSIAPDFESFVHISARKVYSHTWGGMFWFDLPLALILCMLFHLVVRDPLIENLPGPLEDRFASYKNFNWIAYFKKHFFVVIISLLIGIASHLLWDALTHLNLHDPDSTLSVIKIGHARLYIILQYSCSLIGLFIIAIYIYKMPRIKTKQTTQGKFQYWLFVILTSALAGSYLGTNIYEETNLGPYYKGYIIIIIYICISSLLFALIIVSFIYKFIRKQGKPTKQVIDI